MSDVMKTIVAIVIAAGLVSAVALTRPAPISAEAFSDQGEMFFPGFDDPAKAASLEVVTFDATTATFKPFKVEFVNGRWVIPSHHGYPADAKENMAKAASAFIGLVKEQVISDRAADHEALGVLAPDDPNAALSGRGTRVTMKDAKGGILASVIVGGVAPNPTESQGDGSDTATRRYVRLAEGSRVYAAAFPTAFSTKFADWVETDVLRLEGKRIDRLMVDRYEIDEQQGQKKTTEQLTLTRVVPPPVGSDVVKWTMQCQPGGALQAHEKLNETVIEATMRGLGDLRIVGVRPKPPALAAALSGQGNNISQADLMDLQSRGFFVTRDGKFVANDGEISVTAEDGVAYSISFGEVLLGEGDELSAGIGGEESAEQAPKQGTEARYALVRVSFDTTQFPEPTPPPPLPSTTEPEAEAAVKDPAQVEYERLVEERANKIAEGQSRAESLTKRFADWYYAIDSASFASSRPTRAQVVEKAPAPESEGSEGRPVGSGME